MLAEPFRFRLLGKGQMFCSQSGKNTNQYETEEFGVNVYKDFGMDCIEQLWNTTCAVTAVCHQGPKSYGRWNRRNH